MERSEIAAQKHKNTKTRKHENTKTRKHKNTRLRLKTQKHMTKFQEKLKELMDEYVNFVYNVTKDFPKQEIYSSVSQWRRCTLSIILNYIEGYARKKSLVQLNFLEISYGSFKESKYLLYFSNKQQFITQADYINGFKLTEEIGKMLWKELFDLENSIKSQKHEKHDNTRLRPAPREERGFRPKCKNAFEF